LSGAAGYVKLAYRHSGECSGQGEKPAMSLATLKSKLQTGIDSIDHEHRELVAAMEELSDCFERLDSSEHSEPVDAVSDRFGALYSRVSAHFALEEKLMRKGKYADFKSHKADHEKLLDSIRDMMEAYEQGHCADCARTLRDCLEDWFSGHVDLDASLNRLKSDAIDRRR
jgi:hemerythrin-like metal-binding protein